MKKKLALIVFFAFWFMFFYLEKPITKLGITKIKTEIPLVNNNATNKEPEILSIADKVFTKNVPFTVQAPFSNWKDERQQDGCEEASSLMAIKWAKGEKLTKKESLDYIIKTSDYLKKTYGEYRDISIQDTFDWILKDYFKYEKIELINNITIKKIITELNNKKILIVPANGQLLKNPHFNPPDPKTPQAIFHGHMLIVFGYDITKNIFITNDPGTRFGENYEYDMDLFYNAIQSYPTGYHEPINTVEKTVIAVWK